MYGELLRLRQSSDRRDRVFQIERLDKCREIVGISIHVVSIAGLARATVTSTVMSYAAIAFEARKNI